MTPNPSPPTPLHLIQLLLPLYDNVGTPFPSRDYARIRDELTERFGGVTAYLQSPAEGLWRESPAQTVRDEIVIYEVMTAQLDRAWWEDYRRELTRRFRQELLIVRASRIELL